jgi:LysR family transcriptional regulator, hydrogen peroxide-inducible genes activator
MDLPQIGQFLVLARLLNFTRAAEECRITQPAFSRSIRRLELELGGDLLLRERSLTQLTKFGQAMLPLLEQIMIAADAAKAEALQLHSQQGAPFHLGLSPWLGLPLVTPILAEVVRSVAKIEFSVTVDKEPALRERMLQGELDVFIGMRYDHPPARFNQWPLFSATASLFLPHGHAISNIGEIRTWDLADATLLGAFGADALPEVLLTQVARTLGRRPNTPHRAGNWETSLQLVRSGFGLSLGLSCWTTPDDLVARRLREPELKQDVVIETIGGRPRSAAATSFIKLARAKSWL